MEEFQNHAVSGKDFDPQELDSMGRWFADVGILGFNPTNWMGGVFGEMRAAGMSVDEAYRHARGMYTYGMNGRSAAEMLSINPPMATIGPMFQNVTAGLAGAMQPRYDSYGRPAGRAYQRGSGSVNRGRIIG